MANVEVVSAADDERDVKISNCCVHNLLYDVSETPTVSIVTFHVLGVNIMYMFMQCILVHFTSSRPVKYCFRVSRVCRTYTKM